MRRRAQFPSIEDLKEKAKTAQVDNDKTWKHVDEETAENQQFLEAFWRSSTWNGMRKADLVEQMKKVFEDLWDDEKCNQLTKQKLVEMVMQRLNTIKSDLEGRGGDPLESIAGHMNWLEWHSHQKAKKKKEEESFEAKRNVFQSCGKQIAERWQHGMDLDSDTDMSDDDD